jgi:hypothetical protein
MTASSLPSAPYTYSEPKPMGDPTVDYVPAIWRVKYGEGNASGTGSGGDWRYYEAKDYEHMERDLLDALLNGDCGDGHERPRRSRSRHLSRVLRRHRSPEVDEDYKKWRRYEVIEVAFLDGDEWVPVEVSWTPPSVNLARTRNDREQADG